MRVVGGRFKGTRLFFPKNKFVRPTQDRVKESVFNILGPIGGLRVLDLFCGTGGLGIEALSRGAERAVFVDRFDKTIRQNLEKIGIDSPVFASSVNAFLAGCDESFDIIFLDPPWNQEALYFDALKRIIEFDILTQGGVVVCEHQESLPISDLTDWEMKSDHKYGGTLIKILKKRDE
ncbi:MAG: 16S rRNA (guanine966-N2)-methyltransferase [Candidatus Marinamargulisbacteria bacterium]|jgi:16S rRNA (guanine966-N2)-methyltransferase